MRWLVDLAYLLASVVLFPLLAVRSLRTGKYRQDWRQRRGFVPALPPHPRRIWIHAVSVGEVNAVRGLIETWRRQSPEADIVLSATTDTGIARAREIFPDLTVIRYPLDFSWMVDRTLRRLGPALIVLVELEIWYQLVTRASDRGIPVVVVNGRLSERSVKRFQWIRPIAADMFSRLAWVGAQDEIYAGRFRRMGTSPDRVAVTGSMKWDTAQVADEIPGSRALAEALGICGDRPLWVCGSTGPGEESIILDAYRALARKFPDLQLAIIPRKPERFDEVADLIARAGFVCVRRSRHPDAPHAPTVQNSQEPLNSSRPASAAKGAPPAGEPAAVGEGRPLAGVSAAAVAASAGGESDGDGPRVFLGDTMGELRRFYSLATVVFVGRSLAAMGGSDMMEVAALARPMVVGPHYENFADSVQRLAAAGGIRILPVDVSNPTEAAAALAGTVGELLADPVAAGDLARAAREVVVANRGAVARTLMALTEILQRAQH